MVIDCVVYDFAFVSGTSQGDKDEVLQQIKNRLEEHHPHATVDVKAQEGLVAAPDPVFLRVDGCRIEDERFQHGELLAAVRDVLGFNDGSPANPVLAASSSGVGKKAAKAKKTKTRAKKPKTSRGNTKKNKRQGR